ncbi:MAG: NAD+ synthase [Bacteroidota bacterium]
MTIAVVQFNPTVGDLSGNLERLVALAQQVQHAGADLAVFPELCLTGYPPLDLLENPLFMDEVEQSLEDLAAALPPGLGVIVGAPVRNLTLTGKRLHNVALLLEDGREVARVHKTLLPTYDVFDEYRYFEPVFERQVVTWRGLRLGLHICEDMWNNEEQAPYHLYQANPIDELAALGIDLFVNISASPFSVGKQAVRSALVAEICQEHGVPFVMANQSGANTELIFDGSSGIWDATGTLVSHVPAFEEGFALWDTDTAAAAPVNVRNDDLADLHDALVLGIRDYFHKTGLFDKALIGLSGGIDSALTCALAVEALGPDRVLGVTMPSAYSSTGSVTDSEALAHNLSIAFRQIPIAPAVDAFSGMLAEAFAGTDDGVAEENIQSRARGVTLMALSNKFGHLLLSTGNKSELAVGYATLYGDTNGGLAVLSDVFKTDVYRLARYINARAGRPLIPENTLTKPPSAELRPGQEDADSLPPYDQLDTVLRLYIEEQQDLHQIANRTGYDLAFVRSLLQMVDRNEYKRRQVPPGLRVTDKAFGSGRRLPIVMRWARAAERVRV